MKKFILLTFGFLGWAFYEMSGGADFVPASALTPSVDETVLAVVSAEEPATPAETEEEPIEDVKTSFVDTDPPLSEPSNEVTRVALNLTSLTEVVDQADAVTDTATATDTATEDEDFGVPVNPGYSVSSADTPAIIPSLIVGADEPAEETVTLSAIEDDIRTVSGNRVNVRGGPGTDFGIVSRLVRGDAVEVLQDDGNGWVRMRPVDGDVEGWMADFLLTSG
ncbi:SH3 domain-containing protein [Sulfitobacter sp. JB4-11]|uniref:SH3 domain-containing protein n=1 Tax=Sulfitobacter rhodophyticola TaxID=3238304 RepID=UPI0035192DD2